MIYAIELYLLVLVVLIASKDATSYLLKTTEKNALVDYRVKRWHFEGVLIYIVAQLPLFILAAPWEVFTAGILMRLIFFDPVFNQQAHLPFTYLGSSATVDNIFTKIFGKFGAIKKGLTFLIILLLLNAYKLFIQ